jgi:hypothetical protein
MDGQGFWTILGAGNRGNALVRSGGAQVYRDLSEGMIEMDNCAGNQFGPVKVPAGSILRSRT